MVRPPSPVVAQNRIRSWHKRQRHRGSVLRIWHKSSSSKSLRYLGLAHSILTFKVKITRNGVDFLLLVKIFPLQEPIIGG